MTAVRVLFGAALAAGVLGVMTSGRARAQEATETPEPAFGAYSLEAGFLPDPFIVSVRAGGSVDASTLGYGDDCLGFVTEAPDVRFTYGETPGGFRIFFVGDQDATLIVQAPDGTMVCNDDSVGFDPAVTFIEPPSGDYAVWVGSFSSEKMSNGYLMLTEVADTTPGNILTPIVNFITNFVTLDEFIGAEATQAPG